MVSDSRHPATPAAPRLYVVTPVIDEPRGLADILSDALGAADVAAVLLRLAPADERTLVKRIKALAPAIQSKGVALIVDGHPETVVRAGADGCHVSGTAAVRDAAASIKPARILGAGGLTTRDDAMSAGEAGADYVMFGEPDDDGSRPSLAAIVERVSWWADVFEIPCVGYAATAGEIAPLCAAGADFVAYGGAAFADTRGLAAALAEAGHLLKARVSA
jgi:thiamine-phosphate pyrophosphorylase